MNDIITLDINTYNALKSEAVKANMIVDHLFRTAYYSADNNSFRWDEVRLNEVLELAFILKDLLTRLQSVRKR